MSKIVYIAEKANVGKVMAEHLWGVKAPKMRDGNLYRGTYKGDDVVVTWAHGHILRDALPPEYDDAFADPYAYPVIPPMDGWKMVPDNQTKDLLATIKREIKDADVVVNGGDPDREGQLLVDEILVFLKYKGKTQRIMIDAWDEKNVTRAFNSIDDNNSPVHRNMYNAGLARKMADWLVGMNFCRAYSAAAKKAGCYQYLQIGRVKSWVLGMVVQREREIDKFVSKKYYELVGHFSKNGVPFDGKFKPDDSVTDADGRILDDALPWLKQVMEICKGKDAKITKIERKKGTENPPLPYSLDTLQVDGSSHYGFSPQRVLDLTQLLYEAKLVTYPRSDCRYIPKAQHGDASEILPMLDDFGIPEAAGASASICSRAFNDGKVTAHHAVIPTSVRPPDDLNADQRKIYNLIAKRYIVQFYPPCEYQTVSFEIMVGDNLFKGSVREIIKPGFRNIYKPQDDEENKETVSKLPPLNEGDILTGTGYQIMDYDTKPPAYFKEDSIIKAMTDVYKMIPASETIVIDGITQKLRDVLKECNGIGTPATRGAILEELKKDYKYVIRNGTRTKVPIAPCLVIEKKQLRSTSFGRQLVDSLPDLIKNTAVTARMEFNLKRIAEGKYTLEDYFDKVVDFVGSGIEYAEKTPSKMLPTGGGGSKTVMSDVDCPLCGKAKLKLAKLKSGVEAWYCSSKECLDTNGFQMYWGEKAPTIQKCPDCGRVLVAFRTKAGLKKWVCFHGKKNDWEHALLLDDVKGKPASMVVCPVCKGAMHKVSLKDGSLKWVCDHGKKAGTKPLWLDDKGGKPVMETCPICGGLLNRIKTKTDKYVWVCDHGKKNNPETLWLNDVNGKPDKYVPCPECKRQMMKFTDKETGKVTYMCKHGNKDGTPLKIDGGTITAKKSSKKS